VATLVFDAFTLRFLDVGGELLQQLAVAVMRLSYQFPDIMLPEVSEATARSLASDVRDPRVRINRFMMAPPWASCTLRCVVTMLPGAREAALLSQLLTGERDVLAGDDAAVGWPPRDVPGHVRAGGDHAAPHRARASRRGVCALRRCIRSCSRTFHLPMRT
jgi:hypothetical protein